MKRVLPFLLTLALLMTGCQNAGQLPTEAGSGNPAAETTQSPGSEADAVEIALSDEGITVDGEAIAADTAAAVYAANDIVFYLEGQDFTYGEGTEADAHPQSEADAHTVVHITRPGTYSLSGKLSAGQIAVDLGEDAAEDPNAVVTLILNGADITCTVAPAVIFYNVYECGSADAETASMTVDTSDAGANIIIADGTENHVNGSYVARIYKPGTVELNDAGTAVEDAKKLHKYDAAFYSRMSMNVDGGDAGTGILNIDAENEGLDSELHLTVNGGVIYIESGNDGINTNEDGVSVTTINDGTVVIIVTGETGEGDGIDSNGWLVINGGAVAAHACSASGDAGIDSDMGIYLNGGSVTACGNMLDRIAGGDATYAVFQFSERQTGGSVYTLKGNDGSETDIRPWNDFTYLLVSHDDLAPGECTLWRGETQLVGVGGVGMGQMGGMKHPGDFGEGQFAPPEGMQRPDGMKPDPNGAQMIPPAGMENAEGLTPPTDMMLPEGQAQPPAGADHRGGRFQSQMEPSTTFIIAPGGNYFTGIAPAETGS